METTGNAGHREPWNKGKIVGQKARAASWGIRGASSGRADRSTQQE
jgi:hypothetical protein